jgi:hypothetical protein
MIADQPRNRLVLVQIPVELAWTTEDGQAVREQGETEVVNAHGAVLRLKTQHLIPAKIRLISLHNGRSAEGEALWIDEEGADGSLRVAVALALPSKALWGINIPPVSS